MENSLSYEDCKAAKDYAEDAESIHEKPEWYMIEQAFKDGICYAKGIQYDFLSDYDKDMMRLMIKQVKEQKEYNQKNIMEDKTFMMPSIGGKSILRSTGEEVEIIDGEIENRGARSDKDWVTYIDSNNQEHIREHLNIQLDFKPVINDTWAKIFDYAKPNKYPTTMNNRKFEVAKELVVNKNMTVSEAVSMADALVKQVGVELE